MKLSYFEEFMVLSRCMNFRTAAKELFISQSTLTRHIELLEEDLKTRLINRTTQTVSLTPTGELLRHRIAPLLDEYHDICRHIEQMEQAHAKTLRIGTLYYSSEDYLGEVPAVFRQKHPDIHTEYRIELPADIFASLMKQESDLIIMADFIMEGLKAPEREKLEVVPVCKETSYLIVNANHPFAERSSVSLRDLKDQTVLSLDDPYQRRFNQLIDRLCIKEGFAFKREYMTGQVESLLISIAQDKGVGIGSRHLIALMNRFLKFIPLKDEEAYRNICLYYMKDNAKEEITHFIEIYKEAFEGKVI